MSEVSYVVITPGREHIRYPSIEEATEAAKTYLNENSDHYLMVSIHEISNRAEKHGRFMFLAGGKAHIIEVQIN